MVAADTFKRVIMPIAVLVLLASLLSVGVFAYPTESMLFVDTFNYTQAAIGNGPSLNISPQDPAAFSPYVGLKWTLGNTVQFGGIVDVSNDKMHLNSSGCTNGCTANAVFTNGTYSSDLVVVRWRQTFHDSATWGSVTPTTNWNNAAYQRLEIGGVKKCAVIVGSVSGGAIAPYAEVTSGATVQILTTVTPIGTGQIIDGEEYDFELQYRGTSNECRVMVAGRFSNTTAISYQVGDTGYYTAMTTGASGVTRMQFRGQNAGATGLTDIDDVQVFVRGTTMDARALIYEDFSDKLDGSVYGQSMNHDYYPGWNGFKVSRTASADSFNGLTWVPVSWSFISSSSKLTGVNYSQGIVPANISDGKLVFTEDGGFSTANTNQAFTSQAGISAMPSSSPAIDEFNTGYLENIYVHYKVTLASNFLSFPTAVTGNPASGYAQGRFRMANGTMATCAISAQNTSTAYAWSARALASTTFGATEGWYGTPVNGGTYDIWILYEKANGCNFVVSGPSSDGKTYTAVSGWKTAITATGNYNQDMNLYFSANRVNGTTYPSLVGSQVTYDDIFVVYDKPVTGLKKFPSNTVLSQAFSSGLNQPVLENASAVRIQWVGTNLNFSGADFDTYATYAPNFLSIDSANLPADVNTSANVTLYGDYSTWTSPVIKKDGVTCADCTLFAYNSSGAYFNVSGFSNYTLENGTVVQSGELNLTSCGLVLNASEDLLIELQNNVSVSSGSCVYLQGNHTNITIDCKGYAVETAATSTSILGTDSAAVVLNVTMMNCVLDDVSADSRFVFAGEGAVSLFGGVVLMQNITNTNNGGSIDYIVYYDGEGNVPSEFTLENSLIITAGTAFIAAQPINVVVRNNRFEVSGGDAYDNSLFGSFTSGFSNIWFYNNTVENVFFPFNGLNTGTYTSNLFMYNNLFNITSNNQLGMYASVINEFNTTAIAGTNIIGGSTLGGNYWANPSGTGYSETCAGNGTFCDTPYDVFGDASAYDYLPLTNNAPSPSVTLDDPVGSATMTQVTEGFYSFDFTLANTGGSQTCDLYIDGNLMEQFTGLADGANSVNPGAATSAYLQSINHDDDGAGTEVLHEWNVVCTAASSATEYFYVQDSGYPYVVNGCRVIYLNGTYVLTGDITDGDGDNCIDGTGSQPSVTIDCAGFSVTGATGIAIGVGVSPASLQSTDGLPSTVMDCEVHGGAIRVSDRDNATLLDSYIDVEGTYTSAVEMHATGGTVVIDNVVAGNATSATVLSDSASRTNVRFVLNNSIIRTFDSYGATVGADVYQTSVAVDGQGVYVENTAFETVGVDTFRTGAATRPTLLVVRNVTLDLVTGFAAANGFSGRGPWTFEDVRVYTDDVDQSQALFMDSVSPSGLSIFDSVFEGKVVARLNATSVITRSVFRTDSNQFTIPVSAVGAVLYDNIFNMSFVPQFVGAGVASTAFNTTAQAGTNIIGGSQLGGNYWADSSGTGYSETCATGDGVFCSSPYDVDGNAVTYDYLPLTNNAPVAGANISFANFNGATTNFSANASGVFDYPILENTSYGKIQWNSAALNFTNANFDAYVLMGNDWVSVASASLPSAVNTSANVTIYGDFTTGWLLPYISKDGVTCGASCTGVTINASGAYFTVTGFSNYSVTNGTATLTLISPANNTQVTTVDTDFTFNLTGSSGGGSYYFSDTFTRGTTGALLNDSLSTRTPDVGPVWIVAGGFTPTGTFAIGSQMLNLTGATSTNTTRSSAQLQATLPNEGTVKYRMSSPDISTWTAFSGSSGKALVNFWVNGTSRCNADTMYSATSTKRTDHYFTGPQATGSYVAMTVGDMVDGNWYDVEIQFNKTSGQCRYLMNGTTTSGYESTDSGWVAPLTPTTPLNVPENVTFSVPYNRPGTRMNYDDIRIYSGFSEPSAGETCTLYIDGASQNVSTGISDGQWSARASQYLIDNNYDNSTHNWSVTCGSLNSTQLAFTVKDPAYTYKTDFCRVMDASGTYELTQNVARSGTDCISVTAVNVSIDCRAYTINATNANGITYNTGTSESFNEYVRNCTIAGDNAIHFPFSATGKHSGWTLSDSSLYGVYHAVEFGMGYQSQDYSIERNYLSTSTNFATTSALFFNNGGQINAYMYNNTFASRTAIYHNGAGETYPMFVNNTVLNRSNAVQVTFGTAMRWTSGGRLYNNILWVPLTTQVQALNHTASTTKTFLNGQKNIVGGCYYGGNAYAYDNTTNSCTDADYDGFCDSGRMTEYLWDAYPLKNGTYDCSELVLIAPGNNTVNTSVEMNFTFRKNSLTNQTCSVYVDGVSRNSTITGASDGLFKLQTTQFWIDHNLDDHNLNTSAPYADIYYGHNWSVNCTSVNSSTYKVSMKDAVYPYIVNRIPRYFRYSGYYRVTANLSGGGSSAFNFDNIMNSPSRHNFEVDCAGYSFSNTTGMLYSNQVNNVTIRNCVDTDATYYGPSSYYYSVYTNYGGPYYLYNNTIYGGYGYPNWFRGGVATLVNNTFLDGGCLGSCFTNGFADGAYPLVEGNSFSRGGFSGTAYFYGWVRNNTFGVNASLGSCPDLKFDGNITGNRFYGYVDAALWSSNAKVYDNLFNRSFTTCSAFNNASMNTTLITGTNIIGGSYVGGNYYANETGGGYSQMCMDYLRDGICDASYVLTNNFTDYLPLTYPRTCYGNQSSLVAPANGSTYITSGNVTFQATVGTYDIVWIYDNGNLVASMNVSGNVSYFPVTGGQHNVTFVQTDVSGCAGNTTTETTYSWIPTSVTLLSPADDSIVTSQYENFTFNVYFAMSETCNLTIDGVVRSSMAVNADGNYSMQAASYLASINYDGNDHNWSVQCTHASTGDYNFTVQYESLNVTSVSCPALTYPNEGDLPAPAYIPVNFSVYDASGFTAPVIDVELTDGTYSSHNENCTYTQSDSQHRQYTCSVKVRYWYAPGDYDVSVSYTDDGNNATGYQSNLCGLGAIIAYVQNYGSVQFPGASPGTSNVEGTPAITVNNTGNTQMDLFMTAYDLDGRTAPLQKLSASAFKAGGSLGSAVTLTNGVQKNLSISLVSGNTSYAEVKLWLSIPSGQTIQEYYSATPWQLVGQNS